MTEFLVALGANAQSCLVLRRKALEQAIQFLGENSQIALGPRSHWYRTPAWPTGSGPDFVNGAISLTSDLAPPDVLALLHEIELRLGRERVVRFGMRTCDMDLLAAGCATWPDSETTSIWMNRPDVEAVPPQLILPHPRLHERAFVLVPLYDIAPEWRHPILGRTVSELVGALPASAVQEVERL